MRLQLLNKQIIDEREEGLANKAGAETAGFLFLALTVFSVGSIFTSKVGLSPIMVVPYSSSQDCITLFVVNDWV